MTLPRHDLHDALGHFIPAPAHKVAPTGLCFVCGVKLVGRYSNTQWCYACAGRARNARRQLVHVQARAAVAFARPRCMICDGPIHYKTTGRFPYTCSEKCSETRYSWFGRKRR